MRRSGLKSNSNRTWTRRAFGLWLDKRGRRVCDCSGYHFPHRRGGGACDHSKTRDIHLAIRAKDPEALLDARLAYVLANPGKTARAGEACPF